MGRKDSKIPQELLRKLDLMIDAPIGGTSLGADMRDFRNKVLDRLSAGLLRHLNTARIRNAPRSSGVRALCELEAVYRRMEELSARLEQVREMGSLRVVQNLDRKLEGLERHADRLESECSPAVLIPGLSECSSLEEFWNRADVRRHDDEWNKFYRQLQDLENLELSDHSTHARRHDKIVKHLRAKRAGRVARKGGEARGQQKSIEGARTRADVHRLLAQGMKTADVAEKLSITPRRVRQLKKGN